MPEGRALRSAFALRATVGAERNGAKAEALDGLAFNIKKEPAVRGEALSPLRTGKRDANRFLPHAVADGQIRVVLNPGGKREPLAIARQRRIDQATKA